MNLESHQHQQTHEHRLPLANYINLNQYMGDWYVIAHIPTPFEVGSCNSIESYSWNSQAQRIDVDYHHNLGSPEGPLRHYPQKAWVADPTTNAEWKVQFFWPFKFTYRILEVAPDYSWTIVGTAKRNFVWIMARKSTLDEPTFESLIQKLEAWGYDLNKLRKVPQVWDLI